MRAASDLHLAPHTAQWVFEALADLRADAAKHGGPTVLCGDIFDQPKTVDMPLYNQLRAALRDFPDLVVVIPGNHDQYDGQRNACEALEGDNVRVVNKPAVIPGVGLCIPHVPASTWGSIVASFAPLSSPPLVFAHQGFAGSYLNNMVRDRTGIRVDDVLAGLVVVTGHYHMPQNVGQVIYCGSPYQTSHAETGQLKGFLAWPNVKATKAQANATWRGWIPERRPYPSVTAPRFWTVDWDGTGTPKLPDGHRAGDIVRVVTPLTRDSVDAVAAKALKAAGLAGAAIVTAPSPSARISLRATTPVEALTEFVTVRRPGGIDPVDLVDFMQQEQAWPA